MPEVWSINTTLRNPERIIECLSVLKEFEGLKFNKDTQALYQKKLVQNKFYKPNNISDELKNEYLNSELFNNNDTEEIFERINDPALRGRTSVSKLNQSGLAIAKQSKDKVVITQLGNDLLDEKISLNEYFFKYFLKWQLPNPIEKGFGDFNINPFLCTLTIIDCVNNKERKIGKKDKGISKEEFTLFIVTLKDYNKINDTISEILKYRRSFESSNDSQQFYEKTLLDKVCTIYGLNKGDTEEIRKKCNNLEDYTDSAIKYFRKTQFIIYRGEKRFVDIAPSRLEEAKQLIESLSKSSQNYENDDYLNYLINQDMPEIPWENKKSLIKVIKNLKHLVKEEQYKIEAMFPERRVNDFKIVDESKFINLADLKSIEKKLRIQLDTLRNECRMLEESSLDNLYTYILKLGELSQFRTRRNKTSKAPLCLEWYTSLSLMALDDAIEIKPNLIKGDDGLPLFTAPGGNSDIECFYESFNLVVEVTLMKDRGQVNNEVQPTLRHLREFENRNPDKKTYCLFIAPMIHRDANNMFWYYSDNGYEGSNINFIPLTITQYMSILGAVLEKNSNGKHITHTKLEEILEKCSEIPKIHYESQNWHNLINSNIDNWINSF
ncbi:MAG: AlwI family type II restriction endonuclease [Methanobacteriaceae archaeon]